MFTDIQSTPSSGLTQQVSSVKNAYSKCWQSIRHKITFPQEVCDQILEAAKESSVGEDGVLSQVKIRKPKG
ncbi:hypothetical protein OFC62_33735, partial [Escherichia coli]|nr:hypothetical protein [Escherichia coli]